VDTSISAPSDADLLQRWEQGCAQAGNELIERYFGVVQRFFRNKVGCDIEDLVQRTFLACVEARARYRGESSFKTFLLAIARNQLFTHYGKHRRHARDVGVTSVRDPRTSPTGLLAKSEDERLLAEALQSIPLTSQIVLELLYWEGLDAGEIAGVLEVPLNTAYSHLRRAKLALRAKLHELSPERSHLSLR
jgi:RNA polymerase sigma factor (sigma-70 family)